MKFNSMIPECSVSDMTNSLFFYVNILGFQIEYQREETGFAFLSLQDVQLMIEKTNETWATGALSYPYGRGINLQIQVDDVSAIRERLQQANYPIFVEPEDHWYRVRDEYYGLRELLVLDPDGYLLRFSQEIAGGTSRGNCDEARTPSSVSRKGGEK